MKLSFKDFIKKVADDYKKSQSPEEIKKKIKKEKLKAQLEAAQAERERIQAKRRKASADKWNVKIGLGDEK